jgi:aryl-alcohol dehydrogenase-like predicted oxidoreductase
VTPAQVSLAWLLHRDAITAPIIGARTVDQFEESLEATDVTLTAEQLAELHEGME